MDSNASGTPIDHAEDSRIATSIEAGYDAYRRRRCQSKHDMAKWRQPLNRQSDHAVASTPQSADIFVTIVKPSTVSTIITFIDTPEAAMNIINGQSGAIISTESRYNCDYNEQPFYHNVNSASVARYTIS